MKTMPVSVLLLLVTIPCAAQKHYTAAQVIGYAKALDVQTLDPSLPSQALDDWLRNGPPHAKVEWTLADTCDNKPFRDEEYPLCAKIWFSRSGEAGSILVEVGTRHKGIVGKPKLYDILGWEEGTFIMTDGVQNLSGLTALLDQPAYAHVVGRLYEEIVEHHPIGIPTDTEMAAIRPFLSQRLIEHLQTAKACEADYFGHHQHPADGSNKPGWMNSDLFSGDGNRAAPASAWPVREGQQKDGSYLVMVNLFGQTIDLGNGLKGGSASGGTWHVQVKVISENGRSVVDDVRLFDGSDVEGPSHLLSGYFTGCDGPRWRAIKN